MEDHDSNPLGLADNKQKHDQDMLSAEDLAWADSCLIEDPEISETNMDSLKEALLHILDQHFDSPSANEQGEPNDKNTPEKVTPYTTRESVDQDLDQERYDVLSIFKKQPFLPNFSDEMMNIRFSDNDGVGDAGFVVSELVSEPRSDEEGIFKVWDLDISDEEDELDKQLKEALSSNSDDTRGRKTKGLKTESLDSLIESIADLSMK